MRVNNGTPAYSTPEAKTVVYRMPTIKNVTFPDQKRPRSRSVFQFFLNTDNLWITNGNRTTSIMKIRVNKMVKGGSSLSAIFAPRPANAPTTPAEKRASEPKELLDFVFI